MEAPNWKALMTAAIQGDAVHGGKAITVSPQATPRPCPPALGGADYLVALVGFPAGYHFMRRDEQTQRWSHKNGSAADVATIAYDIPKARYLVIDNSVAYLSVPVGGIPVAGPA